MGYTARHKTPEHEVVFRHTGPGRLTLIKSHGVAFGKKSSVDGSTVWLRPDDWLQFPDDESALSFLKKEGFEVLVDPKSKQPEPDKVDERVEEYQRVCKIAADYTRIHPNVTILTTQEPDSENVVFSVALKDAKEPKAKFEESVRSTKSDLFGLFDDATGMITTEETGLDEDDSDNWIW